MELGRLADRRTVRRSDQRLAIFLEQIRILHIHGLRDLHREMHSARSAWLADLVRRVRLRLLTSHFAVGTEADRSSGPPFLRRAMIRSPAISSNESSPSRQALIGFAFPAACYGVFIWALLPARVVPFNDDFGYYRSVAATLAHGRPW